MRKKFLRKLALGLAVVVGVTSISVSNLGSAKAADTTSNDTTVLDTVGAEDLSTGWWGDHSDSWKVEKGQSLVVTFKNDNPYDTGTYSTWNNYSVVLSSAAYGADGYSEYIVQRADNYGWGDSYDAANLRSWIEWDYHGSVYDGATCQMVVSRDENNLVNVVVYALNTIDIDGTATEKRFYNAQKFTITDADGLYAHLTVDTACLTIQDVAYYEGVVVGAPNMSSGFEFAFTPSVEVADGETVTYNLKNYIGGANWDSLRAIISSTAYGDASRSDYLIVRLDNYLESGTCLGADGWNTNVGALASNFNWEVFKSALSGADTTVTVTRAGARVTYRMEAAGLDGNTYYEQAEIDLPSETDPCYMWLTTTWSYFVADTGIVYADAGSDLEVNVGETVQVEPGIVASFSDITYSSSDETVATVDENGVVTGVDKGTATITVTYTNGDATASDTCTVTVYKPMTGITVDKTEVDLYVGPGEDTHTIVTTVAPSDTTDTPVITYESSDETIATVSDTGEVTAVGPGTATITVTATAGTNVKTAEVKVNSWVNPTGIKVENSNIVVYVGDTEEIKYSVLPDNVNVDYEFKIYTDETDTSVATVDENGVVTGVKAGTTIV